MARSKPAKKSRRPGQTDGQLLAYARQLLDASTPERYVRAPRAPERDELVELIDDWLNEWYFGAPVGPEDLALRILAKYAIMGRDQAEELGQRAREHPLIQELACGCVYDLEAQEFAVMCEEHQELTVTD